MLLETYRILFLKQSESLNSECEALKEKVEELTIDLEIMKNEISESGTPVCWMCRTRSGNHICVLHYYIQAALS